MEVSSIFKALILFSVVYDSCYGMFHFDLFAINGLSPSIITVKGTSAEPGPDKRTQGIHFSSETDDIKLNNAYFSYIANTIQRSNDITFAVYFKIMRTNKREHTWFPFFALRDTAMQNNYFSIGFESKQAFRIVEGKREYYDKIDWTVNIEQWVSTSKSSTKTPFKLGDNLKLGKWMILEVRIRNDDVEVKLDCKKVGGGKLRDGRVGKFSYDGSLTFSQFLTNNDKKQFVGTMFEPQIISGQKAYDWYNPCTRDKTPSVIKPEPRPSEYNDKKFKIYQDMSQQNSPKIIISCTDSEGKERRNNGDAWVVRRCYKYRCIDGKINVRYQCRKCSDGGVKYKSDEKWIDKSNKCLQKECMMGRHIKETKLTCNTLSCPVADQETPKGACCPRCKQDGCKQKRHYINSCERKCSDGPSFVCQTKSKGCWCPPNTALNHERTACIPTRECKCQVYGLMYLPGQSIKKSLCSNCICSHGKLVCFDTC